MRKKRILNMLIILLDRENAELLILVLSFLKKLSCFWENKEEMASDGIVEKINKILFLTPPNADLNNAALRLLLNLSFDNELRNRIVRIGLLPKLVDYLTDSRNSHPAICILYHLSIDDKVKSMFTYTGNSLFT